MSSRAGPHRKWRGTGAGYHLQFPGNKFVILVTLVPFLSTTRPHYTSEEKLFAPETSLTTDFLNFKSLCLTAGMRASEDLDEGGICGEGRRVSSTIGSFRDERLDLAAKRATQKLRSSQSLEGRKPPSHSNDLYKEVIEMDREQHPAFIREELFVELANRESEWLSQISDNDDHAAVSQESTLESVPCSADVKLPKSETSEAKAFDRRRRLSSRCVNLNLNR